ncbi:hypothetical protein HU200_041044 [Digitaria exilis]|uniref:DUF4220 domain-containing protein n=1 Tax=Digitaria exilis TaxID=1010633 RepID=A0A835B8I4_9POAL|nr:hypothetical protein HU200_041044 [Digitaria exilis]
MARGLLGLWNHWSIQILVLLSLGLQLFLFAFTGIRRRGANPVLRFMLWLAYLLADSTAIFALGHISLSATMREHRLISYWAPFLLLHLGGPDNLTAYALHDNQLWLRHLQILIVQVLGAAYVLYKHIAANGLLVHVATALMFVVGLVKYGERTWALWCADLSSIRSSIKKERPTRHGHIHPHDDKAVAGEMVEESILRRAHSLFYICKRAIVDSSVDDGSDYHDHAERLRPVLPSIWPLMEMELSLMYDILWNTLGVVRKKWGEEALDRHRSSLENQDYNPLKVSLGVEFQEGIIIWHLRSDVFLANSKQAREEGASAQVEVIKLLSNYMMFLLVEHPDMLPGLAQNRLYQRTCENLITLRSLTPSSHQRMNLGKMLQSLFRLHDNPSSSRATEREDIANILFVRQTPFEIHAPRIIYVTHLARRLVEKVEVATDTVQLVLDVWTDMVVYAGNKCNRESHAKKFNSGCELTIILWLMAEHLFQASLELMAKYLFQASPDNNV